MQCYRFTNRTGFMARNIFLLLLALVFSLQMQARTKEIGKLKVGVILPLSGDLAAYGIDAVTGIKMATRQADDAINRIEVELLIRDSASRAKTAGDLAENLIKEHHVHALIGAISSAATLEIARIAQRNQKLLIVPVSTASMITRMGSHIFRSCVTDGYQGAVLAKFALDNLQKKRAAILLEEGFSYMQTISEQFRSYLQNHGGTVIEQLTLNPSTIRAVLRKLAAQAPEVILLPSSHRVVSKVIAQAQRLRMSASFLGIGDGHHPIVKGKHFFVTHFSPNYSQLSAAKFTTSFKLQNQRSPSEFAAMSYDAMAILIDAVHRARSTRGFPLMANLARTRNFLGLVGKMSIDRHRNAVKPTFVVGMDNSLHKIDPIARY